MVPGAKRQRIHLNATRRFSVLDLTAGKPYVPSSSRDSVSDSSEIPKGWVSTYKFTGLPIPSESKTTVDKILVDINEPYTRDLVINILRSKGGYEIKVGEGEGEEEVEGEEGWFQFSEYER